MGGPVTSLDTKMGALVTAGGDSMANKDWELGDSDAFVRETAAPAPQAEPTKWPKNSCPTCHSTIRWVYGKIDDVATCADSWHEYSQVNKGAAPAETAGEMTPEQFTFQGMTSRQWAYKIIHESAGGPRNLGKLLREFAEAYAKHCVEQAERDKKVGCPSCGVAFTVQGEDLFRGEKAYALLERAEAADLKLAQMREGEGARCTSSSTEN
jgi:hypothetical protein